MEEASRVEAGCFFIDQNKHVTLQQLVNLVISSEIWQSFQRVAEACNKQIKKEDCSRSATQELLSFWKMFPKRLSRS
ncbi:hypothetical protein MKW98_028291 [Papaver atlanticum]|uniref:Uncharacterized protein n=1 Tax=Papaver atlanticum TaxID=357466 RepID=A0AAD4XMP0_9MAGN|nr:hypothetical protein MKW98_028291 [Papaver atlanticum]